MPNTINLNSDEISVVKHCLEVVCSNGAEFCEPETFEYKNSNYIRELIYRLGLSNEFRRKYPWVYKDYSL